MACATARGVLVWPVPVSRIHQCAGFPVQGTHRRWHVFERYRELAGIDGSR